MNQGIGVLSSEPTASLGRCDPLRVCLRVKREVLFRLNQFEAFDEFVVAQNQIGLASAPTCVNILNRFTCEDQFLRVAALLLHVGVDEAFLVKLPEHEPFSGAVIPDHIVVDFSVLILLLRWIRGCVLHLEEAIVEHEFISSLGSALAGLPGLVATPTPNEES